MRLFIITRADGKQKANGNAEDQQDSQQINFSRMRAFILWRGILLRNFQSFVYK